MNLSHYLKTKKILKKDAAKELGITREHFIMVSNGKEPPSPKLAIKIEKWAKEKNIPISRHDLRPDLWP